MDDTLYARVGGMEFFEQLAARFYEAVATDDLLRPMYPQDLRPARTRLALFLAQYFGGPRLYEERRGEPKLRLRHLPFPIDVRAKDAWLAHMAGALSSLAVDPSDQAELLAYFASTAQFLVNRGLSLSGG